jgi:hypothetical protein
MGVTLWVPASSVESVDEPSLKVALVAFVVSQVRLKLPGPPEAAIMEQVGTGGGKGAPGLIVTTVEQLPAELIAVNV